AYNNRGAAYRIKGDDEKALLHYSEAIRLDPKYALAFNNRGSVWHDRGELDRAVADFSDAIRINPRFGAAIVNRGDTYRDKGGCRSGPRGRNGDPPRRRRGVHALRNRVSGRHLAKDPRSLVCGRDQH